MFKYFIATALWGISFLCTYSQVKSGPLLIGDKFPEYKFQVSADDTTYLLSLDDFKGKNIIIDLWSVYCASCISGIQKLDTISKLFKDKFQIILVTTNSKEQVDKVFSRKNYNPTSLPMVVSDTTLNDVYFPHDGTPLHIWLDTARIIRYITGGYNTTVENIKKFINNTPLNVSFQSKLKDYNQDRPLIEEASGRLQFYTTAYSLFTKSLHNIINSNRIEILKAKSNGAPYSIKVINATPITLYQIAYNRELYGIDLNMFRFVKNNKIILESERAASLMLPKEIDQLDSWKDSSLFSYELTIPLEKSSQIFEWMQQDLHRFFDLNVSIQKRKVPCLTLINIENLKKKNYQKTSNSDKLINYSYANRKEMAKTITELIFLTQNFNVPFVDQTSENTNISISLPEKAKNIDELNKILIKNGLKLIRQIIETKLLIIK